jgi:radical SAM superfamily enzyme YgiQ (UPF0313 family)
MRLLLINPRYPESFWSFGWAVREILPRKRAINPPLGLATLAALCPPDWDVRIVDENIESVPLAPDADIVGVCGMGVQFPRQKELLAYYRSRGYFTCAGGSYASLCPERYAGLADVVIAGEAEYVWKAFCADYARGGHAALYRETGVVQLEDSPTPRFDLLDLESYTTATLQFSRGCPYMCEFCDIIVMFGRKPRCKSDEQIGRELDALRAAGARNAFFVDDNLIGNKPRAKRLLAFLAAYQARHGNPFRFSTEVSLNVAHDEELLQGLRDAGFSWVFIGIETTDEASLKATRKTQNTNQDTLASVRRIYSYGIDVLAGFIVGFDNDTVATFEQQRRFITDAGIQAAMIGLLTALPRTPLHARLKKEGRLIEDATHSDNTKLATNVIPKNMPYEAMIEGYRGLYERLLTDRGIADRIRNKMRYMKSPVYRAEYGLADQARILWRLAVKGLAAGGPRRVFHFLHTLPLSPARLPLVVVDWIAGLAMRDYVERRLAPQGKGHEALQANRCFVATRAAITRYLRDGRAALTMSGSGAPHVSLALRAALDRRFFRRASLHLERLLAETSSTLTLRIETLRERERAHFQALLRRLARYGDRVSIVIDEKLRPMLCVDSSVFDVVLSPRYSERT